jgi:RNA polymerase sigma factor (sigma-70 family)
MSTDNPLHLGLSTDESGVVTGNEPDSEGSNSDSASWMKVFRHAYSLVGNQAEAEDLTQETFAELFRAQAAGTSVQWLGAWMRTVTKRLAYQDYRKRRPDLHTSLETTTDDGSPITWERPDPRPSPEEYVIDQAMVHLSAKILNEFSPRERECVLMYFRGFDFAQIASALGISRWTARRVTLDVIKRVRARLQPVEK